MNTKIFEDYFNYKIRTVFEYSILLSKILGMEKNKLWHKRKDVETIFSWVISNYFESMPDKKDNENIIRLFITNKDISKYHIDKELVSVINYFINNKRGFEIAAYEKEIILTASIIKIANDLDVSTSPYKNNKNNYKTILTNMLEKYNRIPFLQLIDNGKKNIDYLLELVKEKVKLERKLYDTLNSKTSFNRYVSISDNNKYYLSQYNYSVPGIKSIDPNAAKHVYKKDKIDNKLPLISKDHTLVTLMKLFSIRKLRKVFFIPIKKDLFENEMAIKELSCIYTNKISGKYIKVLLNYDDYNEIYKDLFENNNIDYFIYCSKGTKVDEEKEIKQYLVSNDFEKINKDLVTKLKEEGKKVIVENFEGIVLDNDLIEESEEK